MPIGGQVKRSFFSGLILVLPLVVTFYVLLIVFRWLLQFIDPVARLLGIAQYTANNELVGQLIVIVFIVTAITILGALAQRRIGQVVFGGFGRAVTFVPLVSTVYTSVRQVAGSLTQGPSQYERVVLVEYPRRGMYSIGLVTGTSPVEVRERSSERIYNVFLPNSPNPTNGRLVHVPESDVHEIDMSVRRALRIIVTTGLGDPNSIPESDDDTGVVMRATDSDRSIHESV